MNIDYTKKLPSIGLIGAGFVGNAVIQNIKPLVNLRIYDIDEKKSKDTLEDTVLESNFVFCCLPTNMNEDGTQDFKPYHDFFNEVSKLDDSDNDVNETIFIIKSTSLYSNIKQYVKKYRIVMNPEFLNANSAVEDFKHQNPIILGGEPVDMKAVSTMYDFCFNLNLKDTDISPDYSYLSIEEAINIKYIHNVNHAYKILFWNFVHETTGNARLYASLYKKLREGMNNEMSQISPDGMLGYGGACFPKDVNALNHELGNHELTDFMYKYNKKIRNK